jgi:hypothetical protein
MTPALRDYLIGLGEKGRARERRNARTALRRAWPHRHTPRARVVIGANVAALRNLRELR